MDNLMLLLINYFIIGLIINMSTSTLIQIIKPYVNLQKYALTVAVAISVLIITSFNMGLMTALGVPQEFTTQPYFHWVDVLVSAIVMSKGSQAIHKLIEGIEAYRNTKK